MTTGWDEPAGKQSSSWDEPAGEQSSSWDEPAGEQSTSWNEGAAAVDEVAAEEVVGRQYGTVKVSPARPSDPRPRPGPRLTHQQRWTEKGFGFIERTNNPSDR